MDRYSIELQQSVDWTIAFPNQPRYSWTVTDGRGTVVARGWVTYPSAELARAEATRVLGHLTDARSAG